MSAAGTPLHGSGKSAGGSGWQLILADLALILFLLTLSALPAAEAETGRKLADRAARGEEARAVPATAEIAAAQALFRPVPGGPSLSQWLASQPADPRATLTVFARYRTGEETAAWQAAQALAAEAQSRDVPVRIIIRAGGAGEADDLYASLAYDAVPESGAGR
jgi:hypothetical protein